MSLAKALSDLQPYKPKGYCLCLICWAPNDAIWYQFILTVKKNPSMQNKQVWLPTFLCMLSQAFDLCSQWASVLTITWRPCCVLT